MLFLLTCKTRKQEFPGSPVVKIPHFHWKGLGSTPGEGTKILQASGCGQRNQNNFPLELATHSSILAWRISWTEEPGLQSMGMQRDRHDWATNTFTFLDIKDLARSAFLYDHTQLESEGRAEAAHSGAHLLCLQGHSSLSLLWMFLVASTWSQIISTP